jgi:hypothetical protein
VYVAASSPESGRKNSNRYLENVSELRYFGMIERNQLDSGGI